MIPVAGHRSIVRTAPPVGDRPVRWLGAVLIALALGLVALSLLGPLGAGAIEWRIIATILSQLYGLDAISLASVAPLALAAGALAAAACSEGP